MMKKLLFLFCFIPVICFAETDDISDRPELGTAVSADSLLAVNAGNAGGSRLSRILFQGTNGFVLTGNGTWFDLTTALVTKPAWPTVAGIPYWTSGTVWGGAYTLDTDIVTSVSISDDTIPSAKAVDAALDLKQNTADVVTITAGANLVFDTDTLHVANVTTTKAADYIIGTDNADEAFGGTIYVTAAATMTTPARAVRQNYCVTTIGDVAVSLDVNAADKMILDGVTLADGDKATNSSKSGDTICCQDYSADGQYCWSATVLGGHWTDGN